MFTNFDKNKVLSYFNFDKNDKEIEKKREIISKKKIDDIFNLMFLTDHETVDNDTVLLQNIRRDNLIKLTEDFIYNTPKEQLEEYVKSCKNMSTAYAMDQYEYLIKALEIKSQSIIKPEEKIFLERAKAINPFADKRIISQIQEPGKLSQFCSLFPDAKIKIYCGDRDIILGKYTSTHILPLKNFIDIDQLKIAATSQLSSNKIVYDENTFSISISCPEKIEENNPFFSYLAEISNNSNEEQYFRSLSKDQILLFIECAKFFCWNKLSDKLPLLIELFLENSPLKKREEKVAFDLLREDQSSEHIQIIDDIVSDFGSCLPLFNKNEKDFFENYVSNKRETLLANSNTETEKKLKSFKDILSNKKVRNKLAYIIKLGIFVKVQENPKLITQDVITLAILFLSKSKKTLLQLLTGCNFVDFKKPKHTIVIGSLIDGNHAEQLKSAGPIDNLDFIKEKIKIAPEKISLLMEISSESIRNNKDFIHFLLSISEKTDFRSRYADTPKKIRESIIKYIGSDLRNDRSFMMELIQKDIRYAESLGDNLKNDKEIADFLFFLKSQGIVLQFLGDEIKNNPKEVLRFIKKEPNNIIWIGNDLKNNSEIANAFLDGTYPITHHFRLFGDKVKNSIAIMTKAVAKDPEYMRFAGDAAKNSLEVAETLLDNPNSTIAHFQLLGNKVKNNLSIITKAIAKDHEYMRFAGDAAKNSLEVAETLLDNPNSTIVHFQLLGDIIKSNPILLKKAFKRYGVALKSSLTKENAKNLAYVEPNIKVAGKNGDSVQIFQIRYFNRPLTHFTDQKYEQIEFQQKKYTFLDAKEESYPLLGKIKIIAIFFFSLGTAALFSSKIRRHLKMVFQNKRIRAVYMIDDTLFR